MSEPAPNLKSRRGFGKPLFLWLPALLVTGVVIGGLTHRDYKGRPVKEWVKLAMAGDSDARTKVIEIGKPAVPYLVEGLSSINHGTIHKRLEWLRVHVPERIRWEEAPDCRAQHEAAGNLLSQMGEAVRPAVPALVRCLKDCPELHYINSYDLLEDLGMMGPVASEALPYFVELANQTNGSFRFLAASYAYDLTDKTNLLVDTFMDVATTKPQEFLSSRELFWYRGDPEINRHIVPVLIHLLSDPRINDIDRASAIFELESRGPDALAALPALGSLLFRTHSVEIYESIVSAVPRIVGLVNDEQQVAWNAAVHRQFTDEALADNPVGSVHE